jgi:LAS superfamily LD-carboxypeptidase LdcB
MRFLIYLTFFLPIAGCIQDSGAVATTNSGSSIMSDRVLGVDDNYLLGKFDPTKHVDFEMVGAPYTDKAGMYLRKETFAAFKRMYAAALRDGYRLNIISATRNFERQKQIWEGKWQGYAAETPVPIERARRILAYSSMPGTSRHHWGTDLDLNDLNNRTFREGGKLSGLYQWLCRHAGAYGFCQPYTEKGTDRPRGYEEERWHWTYTPLSADLLSAYQTQITNERINGFLGAALAPELDAVGSYVGGINHHCKH